MQPDVRSVFIRIIHVCVCIFYTTRDEIGSRVPDASPRLADNLIASGFPMIESAYFCARAAPCVSARYFRRRTATRRHDTQTISPDDQQGVNEASAGISGFPKIPGAVGCREISLRSCRATGRYRIHFGNRYNPVAGHTHTHAFTHTLKHTYAYTPWRRRRRTSVENALGEMARGATKRSRGYKSN